MFKYLKLLLAGKDAVAAYYEDQEKYKSEPIFLHRRFIGSLFGVLGIVLSIAGINWIDVNKLQQAYWEIIPGIMTLYGVWLTHKGIKGKKSTQRIIAHQKMIQKDDSIKQLIAQVANVKETPGAYGGLE